MSTFSMYQKHGSLTNVQYRSGSYFENLADKLIYDEVKLDVKLVATI